MYTYLASGAGFYSVWGNLLCSYLWLRALGTRQDRESIEVNIHNPLHVDVWSSMKPSMKQGSFHVWILLHQENDLATVTVLHQLPVNVLWGKWSVTCNLVPRLLLSFKCGFCSPSAGRSVWMRPCYMYMCSHEHEPFFLSNVWKLHSDLCTITCSSGCYNQVHNQTHQFSKQFRGLMHHFLPLAVEGS